MCKQWESFNTPHLIRIGLAAAEALGQRGVHVVVSSRRQANVDKAVSLLRSKNIQVTGTTCNVGKSEDREKLVQMVRLCFTDSTAVRKQFQNQKQTSHTFRRAVKCNTRFSPPFFVKTVEQCGGVDILVNNAAVNPFFGNILDSTESVWDKVQRWIFTD